MDVKLEYVLPLRWKEDSGAPELTDYLHWLARHVDVTVVDGSAPDLFAAHAERWGHIVRHVHPDPWLDYANGKVNGVTTGLRLARHEHVIIADDDVRYDEGTLRTVDELLDGVDLVRPQNYFEPSPWHARWDTARTLLNRALAADYPGTLGIRRSMFTTTGGYDGNALFENLELIRTVY
ncbi:MAG: glycosyltransferase, partial [Longispora sp.]|nr:glycosyltransferase [Longispora sp. (in: high G+C Gram-positive bacteria)]